MALLNPHIPWGIGFQLSVMATLGLVLYGQPLEEWFVKLAAQKVPEERAHKLVGPVSEFFLFTLAAQVMTLPIMIYHFGGVSWVTLLANPLILPVQSFVMVLGGLAMLTGLLLPGLGRIMAGISLPFVRYTIRMVTWLTRLPGSELILPEFHALWLVLFYGGFFLLTLFPRQQRTFFLKKMASPVVGLLILVGLVAFVWSRVLSAPDGLLHITLLDGEGTVLVQTPTGQSLLIGGGSSPSALNQSLGQMLPAGGQRLDGLIVGSTARDDLIGLTGAVKNFPIQMVLWGVDPEVNQTCRTVYALLAEQGIACSWMEAGQRLDFGDGLLVDVLWAGERGAVFWLTWGDFRALIPTGQVDGHWLNVPAPPGALLLPDPASAQSLPLEVINRWSPAVILLPLEESELPLSGEHPWLSYLAGYPVLSNLGHGWVRISTDGQGLWVRAER
jgi:competence protein ComEC